MAIRTRRGAIFTVLFLAIAGGVASGATKTTPALIKNTTDSFSCRVVNAGTSTLTDVTLTIVGSNGATLASTTLTNTPPGWTGSETYDGTAAIGYCKVEGSYSKSKVHVSFCVHLDGSNRCETVVGDPGLK